MGKQAYTGRELVVLDGGTSAGKRTQTRARRRDGFGKAKQEEFLALLGQTANVKLSAFEVGINPSSAYRLRRRDAAFAEQWDEAITEGARVLEQELLRRSIEGDDEPILYGGKTIGHRKRFPDRVALYLIGRRLGPSDRAGAPADEKGSLERMRSVRARQAKLKLKLEAELEDVSVTAGLAGAAEPAGNAGE